MVGAPLPQQSQFNAFHEELTKPEEIEALSLQMFVARLYQKQDKYLKRICPHLAARVGTNQSLPSTTWRAGRDHLSRYWRTMHRWAQMCEPIAALDDLARWQGPPFEILADHAPMGPDVQASQGKGQGKGQGKEGQRRLMSPQRRRHGAHAAGTFSRFPRLAVPRGTAVSCF